METLILSKDPNKYVFVELKHHVPQHHIDGIRFLYRQFIKKKPGVIINDPSACDNAAQVSLFLIALIKHLEKPVLVLSNDLNKWKTSFDFWMGSSDDILIEPTKPMLNGKKIILRRFDKLMNCRRDWSIIVVDVDDAANISLVSQFRADFKVWISSVDMKESWPLFTAIYKWIYPKEELDEDLFFTKSNVPSDIVSKCILLDAFLADIVLRRNEIPTLSINAKHCTEDESFETRKNKDVTGTKIKKSKKEIEQTPHLLCNENCGYNCTSATNFGICNNNESGQQIKIENVATLTDISSNGVIKKEVDEKLPNHDENVILKKINNIDSKISEMEEIAKKKFKGSILDTLF